MILRTLGDAGARALAANLPACLVVLKLSLLCCGCTNGSAVALAETLPAGLNRLTLILGGEGGRTPGIEESGVRALAEKLPRNLTQLCLHLGECSVGEAGVQALAANLPPGLTELSLFFGDCGMDKYGARTLAENFHRLSVLQILVLDFSSCRIEDAGARAVAERLPTGLASLNLGFAYASLRDTGVATVLRAVQERSGTLTELYLDFTGCHIDLPSTWAVADGLPAWVKPKLNFADSWGVARAPASQATWHRQFYVTRNAGEPHPGHIY